MLKSFSLYQKNIYKFTNWSFIQLNFTKIKKINRILKLNNEKIKSKFQDYSKLIILFKLINDHILRIII